MSKSIRDTTKKRGRPVTTGKGKQINVRIHQDLLNRLDAYRGDMSRPKAIRKLIEKALNNDNT